MAASKQTLVSALIRVANASGNAQGWLLQLIQGKYSVVTSDNGTVLTATSTGGTSGTFILPSGMSPFEVVELAELALDQLETGVDVATVFNSNGIPTSVPAITQLRNSQRTTSYGQFGNVRH